MCEQKLNRKRGKRIVALVIDPLVFGIPLSNHNVVLERRARETMEVHAVDIDYAGRFFEGLVDVAVFENTVPDFVGAGVVMQDALVFQGFFRIDYWIERFVVNLYKFGSAIGNAGRFGNNGNDGLTLLSHLRDRQRIILDSSYSAGCNFDE